MTRNRAGASYEEFREFWPLVIGALLVLYSAILILAHITRPKVTTASDLRVVRGPFYDSSSGRNSHISVIILGETDDNKVGIKFGIPMAFRQCFDEHSFRSTVYDRDPLTVLINNRGTVFSIADKSRTFLNADSTIPIYNGSLDIWKGMILILVGGVLVVLGVNEYRNRPF